MNDTQGIIAGGFMTIICLLMNKIDIFMLIATTISMLLFSFYVMKSNFKTKGDVK